MDIRGVVFLVAHLLITLAVVGGYLYTLAIGKPDPTLQGLVMVAGGYWFGVGAAVIGSNKDKNDISVQTPVVVQNPATPPGFVPNDVQKGGHA